MKKFLQLVVLTFCLSVSAQEFQGKAEYFSKRIEKKKSDKTEINNNEPIDPEIEKAVKEAMKKAGEKTYLLTFSKTESVYEQPEELQQPQNPTGGFSVSVAFSGEGKKYINLKEKFTLEEADIFGKEFLIKEKLTPRNWILVDQTKKIGEYSCFKAELIIPVTQKQKQEYDDFLTREEKKPALFKIEKPEDKIVTAWYTPEIPVSFGPNNFCGLPGLILEINDDEKIILCSKITLNNKVKAKIKVPTLGKVVTQKEFDKIEKDKTDSMKDEDGVIIFTREE